MCVNVTTSHRLCRHMTSISLTANKSFIVIRIQKVVMFSESYSRAGQLPSAAEMCHSGPP